MQGAKRGDWVQIHNIVLKPGERAPQVPEDTKQVPLEMWVKGFLIDHMAQIGQQVEVETVVERQIQGTLVRVLPVHEHSFGEPQPELLSIGRELRRLLKEKGR